MITLALGALLFLTGVVSLLGLLNIIPIPVPRKWLIYGSIIGFVGALGAAVVFIGLQRVRGLLANLINGGSTIQPPSNAGTYNGPTVPSTTGTSTLPAPTASPFDFAALFESDGTMTVLSRQEAIDLFSVRMQSYITILAVTLDNYYQAKNNVAQNTQTGLNLFTPNEPINYKPMITGSHTDIQMKWGRGTKTTTVQIIDVPTAWGYSQDQLNSAALYASQIVDAMALDLQALLKAAPVLLLPRAVPTSTSGARLSNEGQFTITVEPKSDLVTQARRAVSTNTTLVATINPDAVTLSSALSQASQGNGGPVRFMVDLPTDAKQVYNKLSHDYPAMSSPEFAGRVISGQFDKIDQTSSIVASEKVGTGGLTRNIDSKAIGMYFLANLVKKTSWSPLGTDLDHILSNGEKASDPGTFMMPFTVSRPGSTPVTEEKEVTYQVSSNQISFVVRDVTP